jgi:predicted ATPase
MDLALALWQIDPAAEYRLDHAHGDQIIEWRGPGAQPTDKELAAAWAAYQDPQTRRVDPAAAAAEQAAQQRAADTALVLKTFAAVVPDPAAQEALARILEGPG